MPKTVTVFGATGHQGGAVAKALARDKNNFVVRGITRDIHQEVKVDDLKDNGVAVIQCNLDDVNSIRMALNGADACFIVTYTDFDEPGCIDLEKQRGKNIADACVMAGVPHVIYSTQQHTTRVKGIQVRHLVAKAEVEDYMKEKGLPMTSFLVPCYYENFLDVLAPRRVEGNNFVLDLNGGHSLDLVSVEDIGEVARIVFLNPSHYMQKTLSLCGAKLTILIPMGVTPLDLVSVEDIGEVARIVFLNPSGYMQKTLSLCGAKLTIKEIAAEMTRALRPFCFKDRPVTVNDYKGFGKPWSMDFGNMFEFFLRKDQRYHLEHTLDIYPQVQTFGRWLQNHGRRLADSLQ